MKIINRVFLIFLITLPLVIGCSLPPKPFIPAYDSTAKNLCLSDVSLKVLTSTEAVTRGIGRYSGETVRAYTENGKEYLWAWGFSLRKIATIEKQSR